MFTPISTYRIQLHEKFTFRDLDAILDYLHELGISTIYAAPITTAVKGSSHGYDVTDPLQLNPEIGTEEELAALAGRLKTYGMSWLQDIVPNHMAYDTGNPWLYDALERGPYSRYYSFFDIITDHPVELLGDKLMAPFLGATLTECLQKEELTLQFTAAGNKGFVIRYFDTDYPVAARLYRWICTVVDGYPSGLLTALDSLEQAFPADLHTWTMAKTQWHQRMNSYAAWPDFVTARLQFFNQRIHLLESLLQSQYYVLTHHRLASSHINYRRFFTVNSLICLRMEDERVFREYHKTIHHWYTHGWINGLRVDHIDGLAAPKQYLESLKTLFGDECYVVAEKILTGDEKMPPDWPLAGSTGYDFLAAAGQLLTDADGSRELLDFYCRQIIDLPPYPTLVYERKLDYLRRYMGGEMDNLMDLLTSLPLLHAATQDKDRLRQAVATWMACFPVYRAYPDAGGGSPADATWFPASLGQARSRRPDLLDELNFLNAIVTGAGAPEQRLTFLARLMQFTSPLAAKGIEDTSFYVYNPYIAHCEVGDTPSIAGITPGDFHQLMQVRRQHQRHSLNGTTTHDTKRGEDSRMRLSLLSAMPREWITAVIRWRQLNAPYIQAVKGRPAPSPNDEYLIYQALLGGFPPDGIVTDIFRERFSGYLTKALREAKTETNYDDPDEAYEQQCQTFAKALLQAGSPFLEEFVPFAYTVIRRSAVYSLSLLLLKLTAPGIPDIYQGAEGWEDSFVDPDNRRPVDFTLRAGLLHDLKTAAALGQDALLDLLRNRRNDGIEKLYTLYKTLEYRNSLPELFIEGAYIPLPCKEPWLAFLRRHEDSWALIAVPLIRYATAAPGPLTLTLPAGAPARWTNLFTGATHERQADNLVWPDGPGAWPVILLTVE
jgi:(1->4)-alpha-D-glucan 1-alpha-D-glucosylmutase